MLESRACRRKRAPRAESGSSEPAAPRSLPSLLCLVLLALLAACASPLRPHLTERSWSPKTNAIPGGLAGRAALIRNVIVVDMADGSRNSASDLLIEGDRITALGATGSLRVPKSAKVVEAAGLYVLPGLWDMHTHLSAWGDAGRDLGFRMLLANGVTGVRDLGGFSDYLPRWRRQILAGAVGPRLYFAVRAFSGPSVLWGTHIGLSNETKAREAVRLMRRLGADCIKVHDSLDASIYPAVMNEATALGLPVVGHVPRALNAKQVSDAGQKSIEHMFGIAGGLEDFFNPDSIRAPQERITPEMSELFRVLRENGTWVTPTTAVLRKIVHAQDDSLDRRARRRYAPRSLHASWDRERKLIKPRVSIDDRRRYAAQELAIVHAMYRAGVKLLAGSDTGAFDAAPGFDLHDELRMLVQAGLTPLEALRCATRNPAEFLGILDSHGAIVPGKAADLALFAADPTQDIQNLESIEMVVLRGKIYRRRDLDRLLETVETLAKDL